MAGGIDASIPLSVRPFTLDVGGSFAQGMNLAAQHENNAALREQRKALAAQRTAEAEKARREADEDAYLLEVFSTKPLSEIKPSDLYGSGRVRPERAQKVWAGILDSRRQGFKDGDEVRKSVLTRLTAIEHLPEQARGPAWDAAVQDYASQGVLDPAKVGPYSPEALEQYIVEMLTPEQREKRKAPDRRIVGNAVVDLPKKPGEDAQVVYTAPEKKSLQQKEVLVGGRPAVVSFDPATGKHYDATGAELKDVKPIPPPPPAPRDDRLVQIMGPDGAPIWVREADAVGKPAAQAARAVTGQERQALAFFNRAKEASDTITPELEAKVAQSGVMTQVGLQVLPNMMQSPEMQAYRQAQRSFTEARLRKESGAAIPSHEYENDSKTYFAQPGDKPAVIEQKRKARDKVLEGLGYAAGKAYDEFYGVPIKKAKDAAKGDADPLGIRK